MNPTKPNDNVCYDYDHYGNRVRKFVCVGSYKDAGEYKKEWQLSENFSPERGTDRINTTSREVVASVATEEISEEEE